jgi:hypothetical protein
MSIYEEWLEATYALAKAKQEELLLRNAICTAHLEEVIEGSNTKVFGNLKVTATAKLNRTIDRDVLDTIWEDLTPDEQACIDFKPTIRLGLYKKIEAEGGTLLEAVTVKPGQASLKVVEVFHED